MNEVLNRQTNTSNEAENPFMFGVQLPSDLQQRRGVFSALLLYVVITNTPLNMYVPAHTHVSNVITAKRLGRWWATADSHGHAGELKHEGDKRSSEGREECC